MQPFERTPTNPHTHTRTQPTTHSLAVILLKVLLAVEQHGRLRLSLCQPGRYVPIHLEAWWLLLLLVLLVVLLLLLLLVVVLLLGWLSVLLVPIH